MKLALLPALLFFPVFCFCQALEKTTILDGRIEMMTPKGFTKMTEAEVTKKYPTMRQKPTFILSNADASVNLVVNYTNETITDKQVDEMKEALVNSIEKARPDAEWIENSMKTVNDKPVGYFKFISKGADQKIFNYYFVTNLKGKILMFNFNCIESKRADWEKSADEMVASLKQL